MTLNQSKRIFFTKLAFEQAKKNIGSTGPNPSVGCVVEQNGTIISSGNTSQNGRPHAEFNALNKNLNFKDSNVFVTLEPCSHFGKTPPCVNMIIKKKIKEIFYPIADVDSRSRNIAIKNFKTAKIKHNIGIEKKYANNFYKSYFMQFNKGQFFIDAKLAISKDFYTINKKKKWITNRRSRRLVHLLRTKYNCILSTSLTVNKDNSILDCRLENLENRSPDVVIIDRFFKIKKNLKIFKNKFRKVYLITQNRNLEKEAYLKRKRVIILNINKNYNEYTFLEETFKFLKKKLLHRTIVESGLTLLNTLIKYNFIQNIYLFKSSIKLKQNGVNNSTLKYLKKIKFDNSKKVKVNLGNDVLYKVKLEKNV